MKNHTKRTNPPSAPSQVPPGTRRFGTGWLVSGLVSLSLMFLAGCKLTRAGYESAAYKVIRKSGPFEIRSYPALTVVSTPIPAAKATDDDGFMRLFRYISGANETESRIAMTTPVFTDQGGTNRQMSFVVPKKLAPAAVPKAQREDVVVRTRPAGRFAVYRFSGNRDTKDAASARTKLAEWLAAQGLQRAGEFEMANYDPPFTPPFLRRNELLVRLE